MPIEKRSILEAVIAEIQGMIATAQAGRDSAHEELQAVKGFAEQQRGDTAEGERHLVAAHDVRISELTRQIASLRASFDRHERRPGDNRLYAIITLECDRGVKTSYFVVPAGGGHHLRVGDRNYVSINTAAPLARMFVECSEGDEIPVGGRPHTVIEID